MGFNNDILIGLLPAFVFFIIIPLGGAFAVRHRWRTFRRKVGEAQSFTVLDYQSAHHIHDDGETTSPALFFGRLEGIQGQSGIWLGSHGVSVMLNLEEIPIFLLPQSPSADASPPDATPRIVMWKEMTALVEGSRFFVAGVPRRINGTLTFSSWSGDKEPPLVIMYDCPDNIVLHRAMWTGRQRNEYWNHITPVSLIVGFLAELLWVMQVFGENRLYALVGVVAAIIPLLPLFPPGVLGYYAYRRLWRKGRRIRATRDMLLLQQRLETRQLAAWKRHTTEAAVHELAALFVLIAGMVANGFIAAVVLAVLLR